jgi:hypothetical protein
LALAFGLSLLAVASAVRAEPRGGGPGPGPGPVPRPPAASGGERVVLIAGETTAVTLAGPEALSVSDLQVVGPGGKALPGVRVVLGPAQGAAGRKAQVAVPATAEPGFDYRFASVVGRRRVELPHRVAVAMRAKQAESAAASKNADRAAALQTLARGGFRDPKEPAPEADEALLALAPGALADKPALRHALATRAFGERELPALERLAGDPDPQIRVPAIRAVAAMRSASARAAIVRLYRGARDPRVRADVLRAAYPRSADDPVASLLAEEAAAGRIPGSLRSTTGVRLATVAAGARGGGGLQAGRFPADVQSAFAAATQRIRAARPTRRLTAPRTIDLRRVDERPRIADVFDPSRRALEPGAFRAYRVSPSGRAVAVDAANPGGYHRQVYVVPAGYTSDRAQAFVDDALELIEGMGTCGQGVFTDVYREAIVYLVHWLPGGALGTNDVNFRARIYDHPVRAGQLGFTLRNESLADQADAFRAQRLPSFAPIAAFVIYDFDNPDDLRMIPNAVLPTMMIPVLRGHTVRDYGIVRMNRLAAKRSRSVTIAAHELAHGAMNFADEYSESSLDGQNIRDFDALTSLLLLDSSWGLGGALQNLFFGNFDFRLSECLAENAWDNVSLRDEPKRVGGGGPSFDVEGGMFFPEGTWHESGSSLMGNEGDISETDAHPSSHDADLRCAFLGQAPARSNYRIRAAGPTVEWSPNWGAEATLLLMDGDKHHRWHPTKKYEVQLQYKELVWSSCPARWPDGSAVRDFGGNPVYYPCLKEETRTKEKTFDDVDLRTVNLKNTLVSGLGWAVLGILDGMGIDSLDLEDQGYGTINVDFTVDEVLDSALPALEWPVPYQDVKVNLPNALTSYKWRFKTYNGTHWSAWTSWQPLHRAL